MVYFSKPLSTDVIPMGSNGQASIAYSMYTSGYLYVQYDTDYKARIRYPDGTWSNWQAGSNGGWIVTQSGTYTIEGKVWAKNWVLGTAYTWYYRYPYNFTVAPYIPPPPYSISISGPNFRSPGQSGTWTASVTGGQPPYHYQWSYYYPCIIPLGEIGPMAPPCGYWSDMSVDNPQLTRYDWQSFQLKCVVTDATGTPKTSNILTVNVGLNKENTQENKLPLSYSLEQNHPNPFNPSTEIKFTLQEDGWTTIKIFDVLGREIATLLDEQKSAGSYTVNFNASNLSSGIYFYSIITKDFYDIKKMILSK